MSWLGIFRRKKNIVDQPSENFEFLATLSPEDQKHFLETHVRLDAQTEVDGEIRVVRFWIEKQRYDALSPDMRLQLLSQMDYSIKTSNIPSNSDIIPAMIFSDIHFSRELLREIVNKIIQDNLSQYPLGNFTGKPTLLEALSRPSAEIIIETYSQKGIKAVHITNNVYANVAFVALHIFQYDEWKSLQPLPINPEAIETIELIVQAFNSGLKQEDIGLEVAQYLFDILNKYQDVSRT